MLTSGIENATEEFIEKKLKERLIELNLDQDVKHNGVSI